MSDVIPGVVVRLRAAGCVFAEDEAELLVSAARTADELDSMVRRRADGLPLEHVLGWAEFCGLRVVVDSGVFVPRRRTEFLVRQAVTQVTGSNGAGQKPIAHHATAVDLIREVAASAADAVVAAPAVRRGPVVVDLCCGSGALGAAVAAALGAVELHAADVDPAAVRCARRNVETAGGQVYEGDLFAPLPGFLKGRVDILLANVPYVPTEEIGLLPAEARVHEALVALDGGADGLDVLRRVTAEAFGWLAPGGRLLFETSERQADEAVAAVERGGLTPRIARSEELYATVVIGTRTAG